MTWRMPSEAAQQERVWMAFPPSGSGLGDTEDELDAARRSWSEVAHAILPFEPVTMVIAPQDVEAARDYLDPGVDVLVAPLDDAWMRDMGPTFVVDENGRLGAVDWVFNGWGAQEWASWEHDSRIGAIVARAAGAELVSSALVNEGGGIHVDAAGTVLLTETVQLDPGRNPGLTRADVEAELARTIGSTHAIWLPRGLTRDYDALGTRGHVDIVATIPSPGVLLVHSQLDPAHPDFAVSRALVAQLRTETDAAGTPWRIVEIPAPAVLRDAEGWVDYSYINHLVIDGAVIACVFGDPNDALALELLADAYPGRRIVPVDARPIFARGGGIHCITQQQPALVS